MGIGDKLAFLKNRDNITTEELSARSGVPIGTINKVLTGETKNPTAKTSTKLAKVFGETAEYLLNDEIPIVQCNDQPISNQRGSMKNRIREALKIKGITSKQMASILGVSDGTFSGYVNGDHDPKSEDLAIIALTCGVTVDFLLNLTDDPSPTQKESPSQSEESEGEELPPNIMGQPWAFATRVQEAMQKRGLSVEQLAQLTGYPVDIVQKVVSKELHQPRSVVPRYARALRVNAAWIQGFNAPMERNNYGGLPDDLVDLIDAYRMVPDHNKATAVRLLQSFLSDS